MEGLDHNRSPNAEALGNTFPSIVELSTFIMVIQFQWSHCMCYLNIFSKLKPIRLTYLFTPHSSFTPTNPLLDFFSHIYTSSCQYFVRVVIVLHLPTWKWGILRLVIWPKSVVSLFKIKLGLTFVWGAPIISFGSYPSSVTTIEVHSICIRKDHIKSVFDNIWYCVIVHFLKLNSLIF